MKKLIIYLLLFGMLASLVACGGNKTVETVSADATGQETQAALESEDTTEAGDQSDTVASETKPRDEDTEEKSDVTDEITETETEDPRLSMDYAPSVYFSAKDIYALAEKGVYGEIPTLCQGYDEVTLARDDNGVEYARILTYNDYNTYKEAYFSPVSESTLVSPWLVIKYRTTTENIAAEIYCDSVNFSAGAGSGKTAFNYISDGEWQIQIINLKRISNFDGKTINYCRFDFMNAASGMLGVDSYVDFAYIGFFNTENDANMFETGELEEIVYIDPESGYSESKLNHATLIDMINGQNETGIGTFSFRGGNSLAGIDTFLFNNSTFDGGILVFSGWTVIEGGIEKFVWSADNGKTWYDCTMFQAGARGDANTPHFEEVKNLTGVDIIDTENSGKGSLYHGEVKESSAKARAKGVACDLSAYVGKTVNVVFAAVPKAEAEEKKLSLIAYVKGVEVVDEYEDVTDAPPEVIEPEIEPDACGEHEKSVEWHPVAGELKEQKLCKKCGSVLEERATASRLSVDFVEDKNGQTFNGSKLGWYGENLVIADVDASNMVLRSGYDFVVQGWIGLNGGAKALVFRVDGGEWVACAQKPEQARAEVIAAIESSNFGFVRYADAAGFRVSVPLKDHAGKTVTVEFGAVPRNNEGVVVTFLTLVNVNVPEMSEEESEITYLKAIDNFYVGDNHIENPDAYGGQLFTLDAAEYDITSNCTLTWQGWVGISGGVNKYVYSVDGGESWTDIIGGYDNIGRADVKAVIEAEGFTDYVKNGSVAALKIDLSAHIGKTVDVIIAAVPESAPDKTLAMIKVAGLKVTGTCPHVSLSSWSPVEGELKESATCICGETVTRDVKFMNNIDRIEGTQNGDSYIINSSDGVSILSQAAEAIDSRLGKDIVVQGWLAVNGGLCKYVYSIDGGETWLDCGNQPNYGNNAYDKFTGSSDHESAINGADLGFTAADADVNGRYRVTCDLTGKAGEAVTVILGAILENNKTAAPLQILVVNVNVLS